MKTILIINGPNLNMLGQREPEIYGTQTLDDIKELCVEVAKENHILIDFRQTNHEGEMVEWIQGAVPDTDGVIINAAAYTHTSIAVHDALKLLSCPIVEVHLSDPESREEFRHHSYIAPVASAVIKGKGADGYREAIEIIAEKI